MADINLGIIGGGQLGSMLSVAAKKLNIKTIIYCDDKDAPAQIYADEFIFGDYKDKIKIQSGICRTVFSFFEKPEKRNCKDRAPGP